MERENYIPRLGGVLTHAVILGASLLIANGAFTRAVRRQIWERDGGISSLSGRSDQRRECAHYNHDRDRPDYNSADNGRLLLITEHYIDHYNNAGYNGLSEDGNQWALEQIWNRMLEHERQEVISLGYNSPYQLSRQLDFGFD